MDPVQCLAEQRIIEAIRRGDLDGLPGAGRPLPLEDDDPFVPAELRLAYKVLKNAGCLPPEIELRSEITSLSQLMSTMEDEAQRRQTSKRLNYLMLQLSLLRGGDADLSVEAAYYAKLVHALG